MTKVIEKVEPIDPIVSFEFDGKTYESKILTLAVQSEIEQKLNIGLFEYMGLMLSKPMPEAGLTIQHVQIILKAAFDIDNAVIDKFLSLKRLEANAAALTVVTKPFELPKTGDDSDDEETKKK